MPAGQPSQFADVYDLGDKVTQTAGVDGLIPFALEKAAALMHQAQAAGLPHHAARATRAFQLIEQWRTTLPVALYDMANVAAGLEQNSAAGNAPYTAMRALITHGRTDLKSDRPVWLGEPASDKTLLLYSTDGQGFGDVFQFMGLTNQVIRSQLAEQVVVEMPKRLTQIFRNHSVSGTNKIVQVFARNADLPDHDLICPLMDLPQRLGINLQSFRADPAYLRLPGMIDVSHQEWINENIKARQARGEVVVGLAWQGDKGNIALEPERSTHLEKLTAILEIPGVHVISLQAGYGSEQLASLPQQLRAKVTEMPSGFDKEAAFYDTLHVMAALDRVISTDTATAHAAGALGVKTTVMLPYVSELRWPCAPIDSRRQVTGQGACKLPHNYYKDMSLVVQGVPGFWEPVAAAIAEELRQEVVLKRGHCTRPKLSVGNGPP